MSLRKLLPGWAAAGGRGGGFWPSEGEGTGFWALGASPGFVVSLAPAPGTGPGGWGDFGDELGAGGLGCGSGVLAGRTGVEDGMDKAVGIHIAPVGGAGGGAWAGFGAGAGAGFGASGSGAGEVGARAPAGAPAPGRRNASSSLWAMAARSESASLLRVWGCVVGVGVTLAGSERCGRSASGRAAG